MLCVHEVNSVQITFFYTHPVTFNSLVCFNNDHAYTACSFLFNSLRLIIFKLLNINDQFSLIHNGPGCWWMSKRNLRLSGLTNSLSRINFNKRTRLKFLGISLLHTWNDNNRNHRQCAYLWIFGTLFCCLLKTTVISVNSISFDDEFTLQFQWHTSHDGAIMSGQLFRWQAL